MRETRSINATVFINFSNFLDFYARYYTLPPEDSASQLSAEIVQQFAKEFDIDSFANEEAMMLDNVVAETAKTSTEETIVCDSSGPVDAAMEVEMKEKQSVRRLKPVQIN